MELNTPRETTNYCCFRSPQEEETPLKNDNSVPARCKLIGGGLWNFVTHPIVNPLGLVASTAGASSSLTAELLPKWLECIDDPCDSSKLGSFQLHVGVMAACGVLYFSTVLVGIWGAKQRSDKFGEAYKTLVETHRKEIEGSTFPDEALQVGDIIISSDDGQQPEKASCCPLNPLTVTFISSVGATLIGLGIGTIVLLQVAATILGGTGFVLTDLAAGSKGMWAALAVLLLAVVIGSYLIYTNYTSTDKLVTNTELIELKAEEIREGDFLTFSTPTK